MNKDILETGMEKEDQKTQSEENHNEDQKKNTMADILQNKQHKELLFYLSVAIFFLELIVGGVAFFYGIIHAIPGENGGPPQFQFPWLAYGIAAVMAPAALLFIVHLAGVGLFRSMQKKNAEEEAKWQENLPLRLQKAYVFIKGAPAIVLFLGLIFMGVAIMYVDGAIQVLMRMGAVLEPYWPWIIGGILSATCIIYLGKAYFTYRTRRMEHEYHFRMEIFERTGQIIVDKGSMSLPPAYDTVASSTKAIGENIVDAQNTVNPESKTQEAEVVMVDENETQAQKIIDITSEKKM